MIVKKGKNVVASSSTRKVKRARKPKNRNKGLVINMGNKLSGPDRVRLKLKFSRAFEIVFNVTSYDEYIFRLNSLYDPDLTGVGSQPVGYDQWTALYQRYRVISAHYHADCVLRDSTGTDYPAIVGCAVRSESGTNASYLDNIGEAYNQWQLMSNQNSGVYHFDRKVSMAELYEPNANIDEDYTALYNTNPARLVYLHLWADHINGTSANVTLECVVSIEFDCELYQRVDIDDSFMKVFHDAQTKGISVSELKNLIAKIKTK